MEYAKEMVAQEYFRYKRMVQAMEAEMQKLPQGNLTYRNIKGHRYCYIQFWDEKKKRHDKYVRKANVLQMEKSVQRRETLQKDIQILKEEMKRMENAHPQLQDFCKTTQQSKVPKDTEKPYLTAKGDYVRSKSEVIIANELYNQQISYEYEKPLTLPGHSKALLPDFTICTPGGKTVLWEHCGLMDNEEYRSRWNWKKQLYERNGISEWQKNLIATYESQSDNFSVEDVQQHIERLLRS